MSTSLYSRNSDSTPPPPKAAVSSSTESGNMMMEINPNPFDETTTINYRLEEDSFIELNLIDLLGNEVMSIEKGFVKKGLKKSIIDGKNLINGTYVVILKYNNSIISRKIIHLK